MPTRYSLQQIAAIKELGNVLLRSGKWFDAKAVWEGVASMTPQDELPYRMLSYLAGKERRFADMATLAHAALQRKKTPAALLLAGEAHLYLGQVTQGLVSLQVLAQLSPKSGKEKLLQARARLLLARFARRNP